MAQSTTDTIPGVSFNDSQFKLIGWKNKNDPTQYLRNNTHTWRVQNSAGEDLLKFDMGAGYTVTNSDGKVIAKVGDGIAIDEISEDEVNSGIIDYDEVIYSTISDEIVLSTDMNISGGGKIARYDSKDTLITLESNRIRQILSLIYIADFIFPQKWKINSPEHGEICTIREDRHINPFSKPSKSINIKQHEKLSNIEIFAIMCLVAKMSTT